MRVELLQLVDTRAARQHRQLAAAKLYALDCQTKCRRLRARLSTKLVPEWAREHVGAGTHSAHTARAGAGAHRTRYVGAA